MAMNITTDFYDTIKPLLHDASLFFSALTVNKDREREILSCAGYLNSVAADFNGTAFTAHVDKKSGEISIGVECADYCEVIVESQDCALMHLINVADRSAFYTNADGSLVLCFSFDSIWT